MKRLQDFFKSTLTGGLLIVLPAVIMIVAALWVFNFVQKLLDKPTMFIIDTLPQLPLSDYELAVDIAVIIFIILVCFILGLIARHSLGSWLFNTIESNLLSKFPGYSMVKETVAQFIGNNTSPFSQAALVQIFDNETMVSALVTDEHEDGSYTVFVPTGPNPTSGNIYHIPSRYVHLVDVPIEDVMRSIISCGAGSKVLVSKYLKK
jgi:uncharacterized membrane protein